MHAAISLCLVKGWRGEEVRGERGEMESNRGAQCRKVKGAEWGGV